MKFTRLRVRVIASGVVCNINEHDFDPRLHERYVEPAVVSDVHLVQPLSPTVPPVVQDLIPRDPPLEVFDLSSVTAPIAVELIKRATKLAVLKDLEIKEIDGKGRVGVLNAIKARRKELEQ